MPAVAILTDLGNPRFGQVSPLPLCLDEFAQAGAFGFQPRDENMDG